MRRPKLRLVQDGNGIWKCEARYCLRWRPALFEVTWATKIVRPTKVQRRRDLSLFRQPDAFYIYRRIIGSREYVETALTEFLRERDRWIKQGITQKVVPVDLDELATRDPDGYRNPAATTD